MSEEKDINNSTDQGTRHVASCSEKHHHPKDLEAGHVESHHPSSTSSLSGADDDDDDDDDNSSSQRGGDMTPPVTRMSTNVSLGPDNPVEHYTSFVEVPDSVYDRIPNHRKLIIVTLLSYCAFLAPISSTTVLSATPEVAAEFHTTGSIVNVTNALYMLFMGISPVFWGPFSEVWGRKSVSVVSLWSCRSSLGLFIAVADGGFPSDHLLDGNPLHGL